MLEFLISGKQKPYLSRAIRSDVLWWGTPMYASTWRRKRAVLIAECAIATKRELSELMERN
jgi:hypothetical protein